MTRAMPCMIRLSLIGAAALVGLGAPSAARAGDIYFCQLKPGTGEGNISRLKTDGVSVATTMIVTGDGVRGLDIDLAARKVYWVDAVSVGVRRANFDASGQEDLVTEGLEFPSGMRLDLADKKVYYGDQLVNTLNRVSLDGSNPELLRSTAFHRGIAIDAAAGKIYWTTSINLFRGDILRSNLDGTKVETVITSLDPQFKPASLALDTESGQIYWTDYVVDVVRRANLDGTGREDLYVVGANFNPRGIALDLKARKVYWGQDVDFEGTSCDIMRMDLDGGRPEIFSPGYMLVNDLVILDSTCPADCSADGKLNVSDFTCFQNAFALGDKGRADVGGTAGCTPDDRLTISDFVCFQNLFALGCP